MLNRWPVWLCFLAVLLGATRARADDALIESVLTATLPERSISALVTQLATHTEFKRAILLMPGSPGIMKIESAQRFNQKGNFLIRTRTLWLDAQTLVLSVDAPSDEWRGFSGHFRATPRYAEDIRGLEREIVKTYGPLPIVVVGTSEGSVSAYYVAGALTQTDVRVIFSSSLFNYSNNSQGLAGLDFDTMKMPMLWVHHANDGCRYTPYWLAKRLAEKTRTPLITVTSSQTGHGDICGPFAPHGYIGVEEQTVRAMKAWIVDGTVADVTAP